MYVEGGYDGVYCCAVFCIGTDVGTAVTLEFPEEACLIASSISELVSPLDSRNSIRLASGED